jgi:hypothetical protein
MDPILPTILAGLIVTVIGGIIVSSIRSKYRNSAEKTKEDKELIKELIKMVQAQKKDIWRLNKTVLIMAKIIDDQTTKNHPELTATLEDIATELLRESDKS